MNKIRLVFIVLSLSCSLFLNAKEQPKGQYLQPDNLYPKVKISTTIGNMVFELDRNRAPITVNNFLSYVLTQRYNGTVFHRLEHEFVLQGGGYDKNLDSIKTFPKIINESGNGLKNDYGTIAMARLYDPHSATSQFFINLSDNDSLNPGSRWGYAVFGSIVEGFEILDKVKTIETDYSEKLGWQNYPKQPIEILDIVVLNQ